LPKTTLELLKEILKTNFFFYGYFVDKELRFNTLIKMGPSWTLIFWVMMIVFNEKNVVFKYAL
jgi:hypothetical protein